MSLDTFPKIQPWRADIITFTPEIYPASLGASILQKAYEKNIWGLQTHSIHDFVLKKNQLDDTPAGGGAGMVLRPDVADNALKSVINNTLAWGNRPIIYPSPVGKVFNQKMAQDWAKESGVIFLCGRFEGVDQRFLEYHHILEVSLGDFILCGGDVAALAMIESTVRLLANVVKEPDSLATESFADGLLEYPHYTRPATWEGITIPEVLMSGNHKAIEKWRYEQSCRRTQERRPDLWKAYCQTQKNDDC